MRLLLPVIPLETAFGVACGLGQQLPHVANVVFSPSFLRKIHLCVVKALLGSSSRPVDSINGNWRTNYYRERQSGGGCPEAGQGWAAAAPTPDLFHPGCLPRVDRFLV